MICPNCGSRNDRVLNSRTSHGGDAVRRRRLCSECEERFSTIEISCDSFNNFKGIHTDDLVKHLQKVMSKCSDLQELQKKMQELSDKMVEIMR